MTVESVDDGVSGGSQMFRILLFVFHESVGSVHSGGSVFRGISNSLRSKGSGERPRSGCNFVFCDLVFFGYISGQSKFSMVPQGVYSVERV